MFRKDESAALKGIAIILMLFHHCFRAAELYEGYAISFFPFPEGIVVNLAWMSKICVSLFAFISGYGLFLSYRKNSASAGAWALSRYVKSFAGFWFIYVLLAVFTNLFGHRFSAMYFTKGAWQGIVAVILDFLGLAKLFGTGSLITTWWYLSVLVVFIMIMPLLFRPLEEKSWLIPLASVLLLRVLLVNTEKGAFTGENSVYTYIPVFLTGAVFAKEEVFDKWSRIGKTKARKALKGVAELLLLILLYRFYMKLPIRPFWEFHFWAVPIVFIFFCV